MPTDDLEAVFQEQLRSFFFSDAELEALHKEADRDLKDKEELLGVLEREHRKLRTEIDKLHDLYQSEVLDKKGFGDRYRPLATRRDQLQEEIPAAQAELDVLRINYLSRDEIVSEARDLYSRWSALPAEEKRRIVEAIVEKVVIGDRDVAFTLFLDTTPPAPSGGGNGDSGGGDLPPTTPQVPGGLLATRPHGRVAFFSNLRIRRECLKPEAVYRAPITLGQHLAARRRELNLLQRDAAEKVGVCESTFLHWEQDASTPPVTFLPRICAFLGYDPLPAALTMPERMKRFRERNGYTVKVAAEQFGIDPGTWSAWERGLVTPWARFRNELESLIGN